MNYSPFYYTVQRCNVCSCESVLLYQETNSKKRTHLPMLKKELTLRDLEVINFFTLEGKNQ